MYATW
jgi:hypothetical protein